MVCLDHTKLNSSENVKSEVLVQDSVFVVPPDWNRSKTDPKVTSAAFQPGDPEFMTVLFCFVVPLENEDSIFLSDPYIVYIVLKRYFYENFSDVFISQMTV